MGVGEDGMRGEGGGGGGCRSVVDQKGSNSSSVLLYVHTDHKDC